MAWTTPTQWDPGDMLTAGDLNTRVIDNLTVLRTPRLVTATGSNTSGYSIAVGTSYVDIDATNLKIQITTTGNPLLVGFTGSLQCQTPGAVEIDVLVDGVTRLGAFTTGGSLARASLSGSGVVTSFPASFVAMTAALSAGQHILKLVGRSTTAAGVLHNTPAGSVPIFWAWEI